MSIRPSRPQSSRRPNGFGRARRVGVLVTLGLLWMAHAHPLTAQWRRDASSVTPTWPRYDAERMAVSNRDSGAAAMVSPISFAGRPGTHAEALVMAMLGSATGILAGGYVGTNLNPDCCGDDPGLFGAFVGASAGSALLAPVFAHAGNRGRGSLRKGLIFTTGTELLTFAFGAATGVWEPFVFAPFFHWMGALAVEIGTEAPPEAAGEP